MKKLVLTAVALAFASLLPALAQDTGQPGANPDTGQPSANPDTGGAPVKFGGGGSGSPPVTIAATSTVNTLGYVHVPSLVEQLEAKLAYQQAQVAAGNLNYYGPASKRTQKLLNAAIAAANAGAPLPPILSEAGVVVPVSHFSHTYIEGGSLYN